MIYEREGRKDIHAGCMRGRTDLTPVDLGFMDEKLVHLLEKYEEEKRPIDCSKCFNPGGGTGRES